jgi:uncharacterized protein with von Willebrand factor type A (vWA) domain
VTERPIDDGVPDFEGAREHVIRQVSRFVRGLRRDGVDVPADASIDAARALVHLGFDDRSEARAGLRSVLVSGEPDVDAFNERFPRFWFGLREGLEGAARGDRYEPEDADATGGVSIEREKGVSAEADDESDELPGRLDLRPAESADDAPETDAKTEAASYSPEGTTSAVETGLHGTTVSKRDLQQFERCLSRIAGRRWRVSESGSRFDARRTFRTSIQTGGVAVTLPRRDRKRTELRACLLVDVSESVIDTLDRDFLLDFLVTFQRRNRSVRTFLFDEDLTEVTDSFGLSASTPVEALRRAEVEWGGGTRIGDALRTLHLEHPTAVDHRTVVIVVSDGLDVGDAELLERNVVRLRQQSGAVLWLNPLAVSSEYEPSVRGMTTALPYVDGLFGFADSEDLAEIARQIRLRGIHGSVGYEHDIRSEPAENRA